MSSNVVLNFSRNQVTLDFVPDRVVVAGVSGPTGPANTLTIGTVTTVAAGGSATASIGGTAPNQTLSLGVPTGATGQTGISVSPTAPANTAILWADTSDETAYTPVPAGGTTGQSLVKTSSANYAVAWSNPTVQPSQVAGTAVITTDSRLSDARTPTTHVATHRTGGTDAMTGYDIGALPVSWVTGQYRRAVWGQGTVGAGVLTLNRPYATAIYVPRGAGIDRVGVDVTTVGSAGSVMRFGLYTNATDRPGTLINDAGTVDTATSTGINQLTVAWSNLNDGIYWIVTVPQGAIPTVRFTSTNTPLVGWGPFNVGANNAPDRWQVFQTASVSGALTSTFTTNTSIDGPIIIVRCA